MIAPRHISQAVERAQQALTIAQEKPSPKFDPGGGSASTAQEGAPTPAPIGLISAKRELADWLVDWCSLVRDGLEVVATYDLDEHSRLEWLGTGERAEYLAGHDAGMDFLDEITVLTKALENPYLPRAGKKYWGNHDGQAIYIRDGQREVTLDNGDTVPVITMKDAAADRLLTYEGNAEKVALIIETYFGHELKPKRITKAADNDKRNNKPNPLTPTQTVGRNHHYKVEDVLNRFFRKENSTRS